MDVLYITYPNKYLLDKINNYNDIIKFLKIIKYSNYSEELLNKILDIVCEKQKVGKKFKKNECITVINNIRKKNNNIIQNKIMCRKIFFLFQKNILLIKSEVIANRLSVALKNCLLDDNEIIWLINNYDKSNYILNRLLRYPVKSPIISEWLVKNINIVPSRKGEIIGWIIDYDSEYQDNDLKSFIWGVFYSRISAELKKQIIINFISNYNLFDVIDDVIEVCKRLDFLEILEQQLYSTYS